LLNKKQTSFRYTQSNPLCRCHAYFTRENQNLWKRWR